MCSSSGPRLWLYRNTNAIIPKKRQERIRIENIGLSEEGLTRALARSTRLLGDDGLLRSSEKADFFVFIVRGDAIDDQKQTHLHPSCSPPTKN